MRLKVLVHLGDPVPTVSDIWPGAGWPERELYDLFGIVFEGHTDLRRLMMPDDWEGHPLRKDYPVQVRKDAADVHAAAGDGGRVQGEPGAGSADPARMTA